MTIPKKTAAIHDLSGLGHSSLAAVLPILSVMGVQVCPVPTAVLSSQTDGYQDYSFVDLTDSLFQFINHWQKLQLEFDCIYSGFLGSSTQIAIVSRFIDDFKKERTLVLVDPVLGDNGAMYATMDNAMVEKMRGLVAKADIVTPNVTELYLLLDKPYQERVSDERLKNDIVALAEMGPKTVLVTSVWADVPKYSRIMVYERAEERFSQVMCRHLPAVYPGCGDIFASVLAGGLLNGVGLTNAITTAADFVAAAIEVSVSCGIPAREGVLLEKVLGRLCQ